MRSFGRRWQRGQALRNAARKRSSPSARRSARRSTGRSSTSPSGCTTPRCSIRPAARAISSTWRSICSWTWKRRLSPTRRRTGWRSFRTSGRRSFPGWRSTPSPSSWPRRSSGSATSNGCTTTGFNLPSDPVLEPIESIRCQDAILDLSDPENPKEPDGRRRSLSSEIRRFWATKRCAADSGDKYVESLRALYEDRLPGQSDLCCYWFEKAREQIATAKTKRAGLLATQGIRGGANRKVLERIKRSGDIFFAESDRDWILDGATVHVSMVGFDAARDYDRSLDGATVPSIHPNLTAGNGRKPAMTSAKIIPANQELCYPRVMKAGAFDVDELLALEIAATAKPAWETKQRRSPTAAERARYTTKTPHAVDH